jgi:hypothetical protein
LGVICYLLFVNSSKGMLRNFISYQDMNIK